MRKGGIVWADNSVLRLFGVGLMSLQEGQGLECAVAGKHTIVEGVKTVRLKDVSRATHTLTRAEGLRTEHRRADPAIEAQESDRQRVEPGGGRDGCRSLVPYGSGWVTNRKEVD